MSMMDPDKWENWIVAQITAVRELHIRVQQDDGSFACRVCVDGGDDTYPCLTIMVMDKASEDNLPAATPTALQSSAK